MWHEDSNCTICLYKSDLALKQYPPMLGMWRRCQCSILKIAGRHSNLRGSDIHLLQGCQCYELINGHTEMLYWLCQKIKSRWAIEDFYLHHFSSLFWYVEWGGLDCERLFWFLLLKQIIRMSKDTGLMNMKSQSVLHSLKGRNFAPLINHWRWQPGARHGHPFLSLSLSLPLLDQEVVSVDDCMVHEAPNLSKIGEIHFCQSRIEIIQCIG